MFLDNHSVLYTASTAGVFWLSYRMIICVQFISKAKVNTSHHKEDKKIFIFSIFFSALAQVSIAIVCFSYTTLIILQFPLFSITNLTQLLDKLRFFIRLKFFFSFFSGRLWSLSFRNSPHFEGPDVKTSKR